MFALWGGIALVMGSNTMGKGIPSGCGRDCECLGQLTDMSTAHEAVRSPFGVVFGLVESNTATRA